MTADSASSESASPDSAPATGTRERILAAAAEILREDGITARLSVRAVASRAGVSVGSLRHHFPTQVALRDEIMRRIYDWLAPGDEIGDPTIPARDRLVAALRDVLAHVGAGPEARANVVTMTREFVEAEQTEPVREAFLAAQRDSQRRIEGWLRVLAEEGATSADDLPGRARFLSTVLDGLALARAMPVADDHVRVEEEVLAFAADAALS